jgi:hypothetical protein
MPRLGSLVECEFRSPCTTWNSLIEAALSSPGTSRPRGGDRLVCQGTKPDFGAVALAGSSIVLGEPNGWGLAKTVVSTTSSTGK